MLKISVWDKSVNFMLWFGVICLNLSTGKSLSREIERNFLKEIREGLRSNWRNKKKIRIIWERKWNQFRINLQLRRNSKWIEKELSRELESIGKKNWQPTSFIFDCKRWPPLTHTKIQGRNMPTCSRKWAKSSLKQSVPLNNHFSNVVGNRYV